MYAELVFPLPFRKTFTYQVPIEFESFVKIGVRAVAPFGKRTLTGFIVNTSQKTSLKEKIKDLIDVIDEKPVVDNKGLEFYRWLSEYYLCSFGEALKLSVPVGTEIESKRKIIVDKDFCRNLFLKEKKKTSTRAKILNELSSRNEISQSHLQKLVKKKTIYSILQTLQKSGAITLLDSLESAKVKPKKVRFAKLDKSIGEVYASFPELERRSPKQVKILLHLVQAKGKGLPVADLLHKTSSSKSSIDSLVKKKLVIIYDEEIERKYVEHYKEDQQKFFLTKYQTKVIDEVGSGVDDQEYKTFLLHGVTGSGKTQVYIELVKKVIAQKRTAMILVPEISLTPQITSRFKNNFGETIAVIHSRMSPGQRFDAWRNVLNGKSKVVIGARSALFAPLRNIGLIVVDEEHDASYKQSDVTPKYNARDCAVFLGSIHKVPVVLGSATPSVESMYNTETGKYSLLELPKRIDDAKLPKIELVNVTRERKSKKMENVFSRTLLDKIEDRLKKKEGTIILQNRRGFSTQIYCSDCGEVELCDNCSVPMVYHINKNSIQCHYCGLTKKVPGACTHCGSLAVKYFGTGTERVEDELEYYFPKAKISRIDSDTITKRNALGKILLSFANGEIDILVGTQMVSKGLDFSRVTLVGVISAETTLWLPDFRADERTFQLLTQVAGRSGRSNVAGEVVIQTQNEKHFALQMVLMNDYINFYKKELNDRKKLGYPPFTKLALVETKDESEARAKNSISDFHRQLKKFDRWLNISSPSPAVIAKLKRSFRFHILIKSSKEKDPGGAILRKALLNSYVEFNKKSRFKDVKLFYDVDPQSVM